ncbi:MULTISPECIES: amidase [Rhizobium/Agrobacterium group]|uniref:amidase n=1 Tax=Rhizobium/Agrobacterium group TaxID=227290 RepID=UPI00104B4898|nr:MULTISPECIES: amidase [Rhizobium/Agrobacterium group]TCR71006.1 amidase [Rhizobium sp. BK376]
MSLDENLHYASLLEISTLIASGELSPLAITQYMLERIAKVDPALHSYLSVTAENALIEAEAAGKEIESGRYRGPLHGVPIAIKDLFHTKGVASTFGTLAYKDFVSDEDATIVRRLRASGAIILGRLHLHEGAFGEHHPALARCLNPWNKDYWPGGSSSGSGAATAAGLCFGSLGTDTGGSIRFPSAANGVTGLKPTWGRTSRYGVFPLAGSLDTIGPMTRDAADAAAMFSAFAGPDPLDPTSLSAAVPDYLGALDGILGARGFRIGVDETYLQAGVDSETTQAIGNAIEVFRQLDAILVPVKVPDRLDATSAQITITDVETAQFHKSVYEADKSRFGPQLAAAIERGFGYDPMAVSKAYIDRDRFKGELSRMFAGIDALISPVYPVTGIPYGRMDEFLSDLHRLLGYTSPFNVSGSPSITMPCGMASIGVPLGLQLIGPHLSEASLLKAAHAYQQATDWHTRRPNL